MTRSTAAVSRLIGTQLLAVVVAACELMPGAAPPLPPGVQQCIGLPIHKCTELVANVAGGARPVAYRVVCTATLCNETAGKAAITIVLADGTSQMANSDWVSDPAP